VEPSRADRRDALEALARSLWGNRVPPLNLGPGPLACARCDRASPAEDWPRGLHPCGGCGGWHVVCAICALWPDLLGLAGATSFPLPLPYALHVAPLVACPDAALVAEALMGTPPPPRWSEIPLSGDRFPFGRSHDNYD